MTFVRDFLGFRPPPRHDADPFTIARIEEGAASDGPWEQIDEFPLDPVDTNPAAPAARDLTTDNATLDPAWYRIVWVDASDDTFVGDPVQFAARPWIPSVDDVAALLQARLARRGGGMADTFDQTTRPTGDQVARLCDRAARAVAARIGSDPCTDDLKSEARSTSAIYAAMLVEQSYYPGQTRDSGSSFQSLLSLWKDDIKALDTRVAEECGTGGGGGGGTGDNRTGLGYFDTVPLIGRSYPDW